jgi:uncharacterized protein (TIGR00369 family)
MTVWKNPLTIDQLNAFNLNTAVSHLGIKVVEIGEDCIMATMPVDERTRQPFGLLHGGASVLLAESVASMAAAMAAAPDSQCVGLEINANHLKSVLQGEVIATARPVHIGGSTQVWSINIKNQMDEDVCISRCTVAVRKSRV